MSPEVFKIVSLGVVLMGWGLGLRLGWWAMGKAIDWWDGRKARRDAEMRNVTPK